MCCVNTLFHKIIDYVPPTVKVFTLDRTGECDCIFENPEKNEFLGISGIGFDETNSQIPTVHKFNLTAKLNKT